MPRRFDRPVVFRTDQTTHQALALMAKERGASVGRVLRAIITAEIARWETPARMRERAKNTEKEER